MLANILVVLFFIFTSVLLTGMTLFVLFGMVLIGRDMWRHLRS